MAHYRVNEYGELFTVRTSRRQRRTPSSPTRSRPAQPQTNVRPDEQRERYFWPHYWRCFQGMGTRSRAINVFLLWPIALAVISVVAAAAAILSVIVGFFYCCYAISKRE